MFCTSQWSDPNPPSGFGFNSRFLIQQTNSDPHPWCHQKIFSFLSKAMTIFVFLCEKPFLNTLFKHLLVYIRSWDVIFLLPRTNFVKGFKIQECRDKFTKIVVFLFFIWVLNPSRHLDLWACCLWLIDLWFFFLWLIDFVSLLPMIDWFVSVFPMINWFCELVAYDWLICRRSWSSRCCWAPHTTWSATGGPSSRAGRSSTLPGNQQPLPIRL